MDFSYTEEQVLLKDSLARYLKDKYTFETRRKAIASAAGWRPEFWRALADELGLLGASFDQGAGGLGGGAVENMIVMEALGRALVLEPYLATVVMAGGFLKRATTPGARAALDAIIAGRSVVAVAVHEAAGGFDPAMVACTAQRGTAGYVLNGHKAVVFGAAWAQSLIVTARTGGLPGERHGVSVFLLARACPGLRLQEFAAIDGQRACEVYLDQVQVPVEALLCAPGQGLPLVEQVLDEGTAALCAEGLGVMREMHESTLAYARERKQFGRPIAEFQVLQHRMVDMLIEIEQAVSLTLLATLSLELAPAQRAAAVSAAKVQVAKACRQVGQGAIQIHGGMGQTEELAISSYFKRATVIESQLGTVDYHLDRYQRLLLAEA